MEYKLGLKFDMRRVLLNNEYYNVYKINDIEVGIVSKTKSGLDVFISLVNSSDNRFYILNNNNQKKLGLKFNEDGVYFGTQDTDSFFDIVAEENGIYSKIKERIMDSWKGYRVFESPLTIRLIHNVEKYKDILDDAFKDVKPTKEKDIVSNEKLSKYGVFLTNKEYLFNPAIGREEEIVRLEKALLSYDESAMIVGESGVGKTAIVEGLAYKIQKGLVHEKLKSLEIISISSTFMISGTRYVGDKEERMLEIINELKKNKNIIMFTDEIHTLEGAGRGEKSNIDIANILKPYLDRGDIKIIGSTTESEYNDLMLDKAFKRRFKKVNVLEPENDTLIKILDGVIDGLEKYYDIKFNFKDDIKFVIYNKLIELTCKQNRDYKDNVCNPALILSIIKDIFVSALYSNRNYITIEDILCGISECDKLYKSVKDRISFSLLNLISDEKTEEKVLKKSAILPFVRTDK